MADDRERSDEELLRALGSLAREQEREGARSAWERLARGELSADEARDLERGADEDADAQLLLAAARPLDAAAQERITASLEARLTPVRRPSRWRRHFGVGAGGLALAAAVALFVSTSRPEDLPRYALDSSGAATTRAPADPPARPRPVECALRASAQGSFELLARPDEAVSGPVVARAYVVRGGDVEAWSKELEVSAKGSIRLLGESEKLAGASEVRIVVGRPDRLEPAAAHDLARGGSSSGRGWQVLRCRIDPP